MLMTIGVFTLAFVLGIGFIPFWIIIGGGWPLGSAIGYGHLILSQLANGGSAIYYPRQGDAEIVPAKKDSNTARIGSDWVDLGEDTRWYQLAWAPFTIVTHEEPRFAEEFAVEESERNSNLLTESRSGTRIGTTHTETKTGEKVYHWMRYQTWIGRNGTRLINRIEEKGLKDFGGDSQLGQVTMLLTMVSAFILMFGLTWVMLEVL